MPNQNCHLTQFPRVQNLCLVLLTQPVEPWFVVLRFKHLNELNVKENDTYLYMYRYHHMTVITP